MPAYVLYSLWDVQIKSPVSYSGHNQCTKFHVSKQVLFLAIDYVETSTFFKKMSKKYSSGMEREKKGRNIYQAQWILCSPIT